MSIILLSKVVVLTLIGISFACRIPHLIQSRRIRVVERRFSEYQDLPLTIAKLGLLLPIFWCFSPRLDFANFTPIPGGLMIGMVLFAPSLWLLHRSHTDLGTNWSITLEMRENHRLVTQGVYRKIRHPMYLSLLLFALGLVAAVPNYLAGPSMLITMLILFFVRVDAEERMMHEAFGDEYKEYCQQSHRLIPGVW